MKPILIVGTSILVISVSIFLYRCNKDYYADYNVVKTRLEKLHGIKILKIWGNEDLTLEDIYAIIRLENGDTLRFSGLGGWSFDSTKSISLTRINNYEFHTTGCTGGGHWGGGSLSVGENSPYRQIKELGLKNVQDVIKYIDKLKNIVKYPSG